VGQSITTTVAANETQPLWQGFMSRRKEIQGIIDGVYYSVEVYHEKVSFGDFTPETKFDKWACVEVESVDELPAGMGSIRIPTGLYAVFTHLGPTALFPHTLSMIYEQWLPASMYELDQRPHFEVMDKDYLGPTHPDSKEKVWVPIK
jgi:AraC family transcriptional regulator